MMWPEKVDKFAVRLCSSPMSARTELNSGSRAGACGGEMYKGDEQWQELKGLSVTVVTGF